MWNRVKRLFGHRWREARAPRQAFKTGFFERLTQQVASSERQHSGEIRIVVEHGLPLSSLWWHHGSLKQLVRERALQVFAELHVWDTAHNNGVLIYLLLAERAIEIVADRGLNERVHPPHWDAMVSRMRADFVNGRFEDGLTRAVQEVSALLQKNFALETGTSNANELPDQPLMR
jgi:TPM domain